MVIGHDRVLIFLQRCEWHAAEAIKKTLIRNGYRKERRDKIVDLIWRWIQAPDVATLEESRGELLSALNELEQAYLISYY
jgi:hypothetical protein